METFRLYGKFIKVFLKCKMEYRFSFFLSIFLQITTYASLFFSLWILVDKFQNIAGWNFYELMYLYTLNLFTYAMAGMFVKHPMLDLEGMIQKGEFDGFLTKPLNPLLHIIIRQFEYTFSGHIFLCIVTFNISIQHLGIIWDWKKILFFIINTISGIVIQAAFMILAGSSSFFFVKSRTFVELGIYDLREYINYPLSIYQKGFQFVFTFIIPYGFVNFYPAEYILGKIVGQSDKMWFLFMGPVISFIFISLALLTWSWGIKHYKSTGN